MLFNSFLFLLIYLPLLLVGWFGLGKLHKDALSRAFLIGMSLWFYGLFGLPVLFVLVVSILMNYLLSYGLSCVSGRENTGSRGTYVLMTIGIVLNLLLLGVFKYGGDLELPGDLRIAYPVGLSFYTFSQISFLIDRARGEIPHDSFLNYATWITYFPKLVEGPIARYQELSDQFADHKRRVFSGENFVRGFALFVLGMSKKVLIADTLAPVVTFGFTNVYLDPVASIANIMAYAFQLYFDFSGFCDMGMGIARMMNIELPLNFDSPFHETSFGSFWGKWHMTLTRFLTRYVYIPLGGSRKGQVRTSLNILIVFLLSGIWHGNGEMYLIWGLLCGVLVVLNNLYLRKPIAAYLNQPGISEKKRSFRTALMRTITFVTFLFTLYFFRNDSLEHLQLMAYSFLRPAWPGLITVAASKLNIVEFYPVEKVLQMAMPQAFTWFKVAQYVGILILCVVLINGKRNAREMAETMTLRRRNALILALLLVWCMMSMTGVTTYLYFKF